MNSKEIEKEILTTCTTSFKAFGHDDLGSAIISTLFLCPKELSMHELSEKTKYSLPSISLKMKQLIAHPMIGIERRRKPGTKQAYFYMEKDILVLNLKRMKMMNETMMTGLHAKLSPLSKEYKKVSKTDEYKQKSKIVDQYLTDLKIMNEAFAVYEKKLKELIQKRNNK